MEPQIMECLFESCSFNKEKKCHAFAITVGDGEHPKCDTFAALNMKAGAGNSFGRVGACKVIKCRFNSGLSCFAEKIKIKHHIDHPECANFEAGW